MDSEAIATIREALQASPPLIDGGHINLCQLKNAISLVGSEEPASDLTYTALDELSAIIFHLKAALGTLLWEEKFKNIQPEPSPTMSDMLSALGLEAPKFRRRI